MLGEQEGHFSLLVRQRLNVLEKGSFFLVFFQNWNRNDGLPRHPKERRFICQSEKRSEQERTMGVSLKAAKEGHNEKSGISPNRKAKAYSKKR